MIRVGPFAYEPVPTARGLALLAEPHEAGSPIAHLADLARRDPELQAALAAGTSWSRYPAAVELHPDAPDVLELPWERRRLPRSRRVPRPLGAMRPDDRSGPVEPRP